MTVKRIAREKKTIQKMLKIYCKDKHGTSEGLCDNCQDLYHYAMQRLDRCKFQGSKPVCGKCPIHCYRKDMRQQIIDVMRYSGPRMLTKHPVVAIYHVLDSWRKAPKG